MWVTEYRNMAQKWIAYRGPFATKEEAEKAAQGCKALVRVLPEAESVWEWVGAAAKETR